MKKLKEVTVKYHNKVVSPKGDMTFTIKARNVLSGVREWKKAGFMEENAIFEVYEDGVIVPIPVDKRGGNNNKGVTQTPMTYYADNSILEALKARENVNQFINQSVKEKLERENLVQLNS